MPDDPLYSAKVLGAIGSQDISDADIAGAVDEVAFSDSSFVSPEMLYGRDGWDRKLTADPEGAAAFAQFDYDWNFGMTPVDRAKAVWTSNLHDGGKAVLDDINNSVYEASKVRDASHVDAVRRRRSGFGGAM